MMDLFHVASKDLLVFTLVFFRMSSLIITMPFFGGSYIPKKVGTAFVIAFSFIMYRTIDTSLITMPQSFYEYGICIAKEIGIGIFIGFVASIAFFAVQLGGAIIAIQMGLQQAMEIDPESNVNIPTMGQFFTLFVMAIFLLFNGHHYLLKLFVDSFQQIPVSHVHYQPEFFVFAIKAFNTILIIGMRIAMPAMALMFVIMIALAFIARLVPQMNVFILSLPAKIAGGLLVSILCLPLMIVLFHDTFGQVMEMLHRALTLL